MYHIHKKRICGLTRNSECGWSWQCQDSSFPMCLLVCYSLDKWTLRIQVWKKKKVDSWLAACFHPAPFSPSPPHWPYLITNRMGFEDPEEWEAMLSRMRPRLGWQACVTLSFDLMCFVVCPNSFAEASDPLHHTDWLVMSAKEWGRGWGGNVTAAAVPFKVVYYASIGFLKLL